MTILKAGAKVGEAVYKKLDEWVDLAQSLLKTSGEVDANHLLQSQGLDPSISKAVIKKAKEQSTLKGGKGLETPYSELSPRPGPEAGFKTQVQPKTPLGLPEGTSDKLVKNIQTQAGPASDFRKYATEEDLLKQSKSWPDLTESTKISPKYEVTDLKKQLASGSENVGMRRQAQAEDILAGTKKEVQDVADKAKRLELIEKAKAASLQSKLAKDLKTEQVDDLVREDLAMQNIGKQQNALELAKKKTQEKRDLKADRQQRVAEGRAAQKRAKKAKTLGALGAGSAFLTGDTTQYTEDVSKEDIADTIFDDSKTEQVQETGIQPDVSTKEATKTVAQDTEPTPPPPPEPKKTTDIDRILLPESEEEVELNKRLKENLDAFSKLKDPEVRSKSRREQMFKDLSDVRDNREKALMWASLAERFLAAATKYAAAKEGRARNLNMSKAEIERTDWDGMIDRAYAKYKEDYENLAGDLAAEDKAVATSRKQREDILKESKDLAQQLARLKDARAKEQARLDQQRQELIQRAKDRRLDRTSREDIAGIKAEGKSTGVSARFLEQQKSAMATIDRMIKEGASAKKIKEQLVKSQLYLPDWYQDSIKFKDTAGPWNTYEKVGNVPQTSEDTAQDSNNSGLTPEEMKELEMRRKMKRGS